jgi:CRISPR system Cascade subunit CasE
MKCPEGEFLWRLEPETDSAGHPRILVQSRSIPNWKGINVHGWLSNADPPIDLNKRIKFDSLKVEQVFRFRLRANPCVTRNGKRFGLLSVEEQEAWIKRKGEQHGFLLPNQTSSGFLESPNERPNVQISQEQMLQGKKHIGNDVRIYSVLYDGILSVTEPDNFRKAVQIGIGHGKVMGLGLLSVVPVSF